MYFTTFSGFEISAGQQRGHELDRIVRLEIGRVIREQRVGGGVRLVEAVAGELLHQVEDACRLVLGMLVLRRALHEAVALLRHLVRVLLAHGAAQQVGLAERVAGEHVGDLHDLLLIDDDAERLVQDLFELRQLVLDLAAAPLALDEVVDHAALDRPGPIERVQRRQVFNRVGLDSGAAHRACRRTQTGRRPR